MTKFASILAVGAALSIGTSTPLQAQDDGWPTYFNMTGTVSDSMFVGGIGNEVYGAAWKETLTVTDENGSNELSAQCIGMDQPENSLYDRHFTCTLTDNAGASGGIVYGCNVENEAGDEMSCYGYFEGKTGAVEGRRAMHTAYYWFMDDGTGKFQVAGQWMP